MNTCRNGRKYQDINTPAKRQTLMTFGNCGHIVVQRGEKLLVSLNRGSIFSSIRRIYHGSKMAVTGK